MLMLSIVSVARDALRGLMLSLCDIIYRLIVFVYDVFYNLGTARLLTDKDIQPIFQRIGLIIGLFMVFRVTFAFIQYIINPEAMIDKQKGIGKIVAKVIISIVLLGSTQYLFNAAFTIQNKVLESQVLEKVILGGEYAETESGMRDFGSNLSATIFSSFYRINDDPYLSKPEVYNLCENILGKNNDMLKENIRINSGSIVGSGANICLNVKSEYNNYDEQMEEIISSSKETKEEYIINFDGDGILTVLVGLVCLYTGFMFTFQIGVRLIQLAYLELIAPIPIMMYVTPKGDDQLKKWVTQCTTTFLDFFLRVAIIYFAKFIIEIILNADILGSIYAESNGIYNVYITCVMIIATLLFVKKVPNLLKEIFPSLGGAAGFSYDISGKAFKDTMKMVQNATPIGWGLKLGKAGTVGAIGMIDRKIHNLPKPRSKFQQKLDKLMPGHAEYVKNKNQAIADEKERQTRLKNGEKMATDDRYSVTENGERKLRAAAFKSSEYASSYNDLKAAKKQKIEAQNALEKEQRAASAAYAYKGEDGMTEVQIKAKRQELIAKAEARVEQARKNFNSMDGKFEQAKAKHESMKKIYTKDAQIEDDFKYWADSNLEYKELPSEEIPIVNEENQNNGEVPRNSVEAKRKQQEEEQKRQQEKNIITEEHFQSQPRQETTSQENIQEEYSKLINKYNNETDPSKKAEIRKQIEDFERNHQ